MSNLGINELPLAYDFKKFPHLRPQGPHMPITEAYVSIPPALWIRDEENALWSLGFDYDEREWRGGKLEYDVIRNGRKTGEFARKIEFTVRSRTRNRIVRIWGSDGIRAWNGRQFV